MSNDREILRDVARRYMEICRNPDQQRRRADWRRHNSLKRTRTLIVSGFPSNEMPACRCVCEDPFLREQEESFRYFIFQDTCADDSVFEPWLTVSAVYKYGDCKCGGYKCGGWGVEEGARKQSDQPGGSWKDIYPLKRLEDIEKLRMPRHEIDEPATAQRVERLKEILGDIITINLDRRPVYRYSDISNDLGYLRGIENVMLDMTDNPEWLHRLAKFFSDGILKTYAEAEAAGDWGLEQIFYSEELPDPAANVRGVQRSRLWGAMAAQEMALVSPAQHEEFLLRYQKPILESFGLTAYGCCENLTRKIDMLRQIRNLRQIAVSPFADAPRCAEQIGDKYVIGYRPNPADMVSYGFDEARIRGTLRRDLEAFRANGCHADITLTNVLTVQGDTERVRKWVATTRAVADEVFGG
jgi:hypothetical protein